MPVEVGRIGPSPWSLVIRASLRDAGLVRHEGSPMAVPSFEAADTGLPAPQLVDRLADWERAGLIDGTQRVAITAYEQQRSARPPVTATVVPAPPGPPGGRRVPAVAEALGYLGGILALVGLGLLLSRVWDEVGAWGRFAVLAGSSAGLLVVGALVRADRDPALRRLRGFLWLLSTLAVAAAAAVLAGDIVETRSRLVAAAAAGAALVHAGLLWRGTPGRPLQQASALIALPVLVGTVLVEVLDDGLAALVVWAVGVGVLVAGVRRLTSAPFVTSVLGAVTLLVGAGLVSADWRAVGLLLSVASALGVAALAAYNDLIPERIDRWVLGLVASVALVQAVPSTLIHFGDRAGIATGLVTWAVGVGLVVLGLTRRVLRGRPVIVLVGGLTIVGGAALCGLQSVTFATLFGLATAIGMVALGTRPGTAVMSLFGSLGLLVNVPWAVNWFFPGEGRAPLLIFVSGALIIVVAVLLARSGARIRRELGGAPQG